MDEWLTVTQTVQKTGISQRNISNYLNRHGRFIKHKRQGRMYYIHDSSIFVLNTIYQCYNQNNMHQNQVEDYLAQNHEMFLTVPDDQNTSLIPFGQSIQELRNNFGNAFLCLEEKMNHSIELHKEMIKRQEERDQQWEQRMLLLMEKYQELEEKLIKTQAELASTKIEENRQLQTISNQLSRVEKYAKKRRGFFSFFRKRDDQE